jgi:hypothetical protein
VRATGRTGARALGQVLELFIASERDHLSRAKMRNLPFRFVGPSNSIANECSERIYDRQNGYGRRAHSDSFPDWLTN